MQNNSLKISKLRKQISSSPNQLSFICRGCQCSYRSYPALYLHIRRKHNGIRPSNTIISKPGEPSVTTGALSIRKPSFEDDITSEQMYLEVIQSELVCFLGEELDMVTFLGPKPELDAIGLEIFKSSNTTHDEALTQLKEQVAELVKELKHKERRSDEIELDFTTFSKLDKKDPLRILCWFLLWLGKYIIKPQGLKDVTIIISRIWRVMEENRVEIQDLDNKTIWNGVVKECGGCFSVLNCFLNEKELVYEFVRKVCRLIGKVFEYNQQ